MADRAVSSAALLRIDLTGTPEAVAAALVALFDAIAGLPGKVGWVQHATEGLLAADADPAMTSAARVIAQAIDADADFNDRQPYHARQHFCEVMLVAATLARLHRLPGRSTQLLLLAALVHDLAHDGQPSRHFRLERESIAQATPHLVAAGVAPATRARLAALVLATEPRDGVLAVRSAHDRHISGAPPAASADGPPELQLLAADAELARLASLLCEADVLPSVGLTSAHALHLQQLLASEWRRELGCEDKLKFVDDVLAAGVIGPFFRPNVAALRRQLAARVADARGP